VRTGAPIVVPPSVGTLLSAARTMNFRLTESGADRGSNYAFAHLRSPVVNGAGAASFVHEIKERIENFTIPTEVTLPA
jgi:hypothetical protein